VQQHGSELTGCKNIAELVDALKRILDQDSWKTGQDSDGSAARYGNSILAVHPDLGLYWICSEFSFAEIPSGAPMAAGTGGQFARGAAYALLTAGTSIERCLIPSVATAISFDIYSGGEVQLFTVGGDNHE
jgi:ATP-dependent protease HslVU (ClpYQ) peptidase subunit